MGTEILIFLIPIPFIFWARNLWQLTKNETRTKAALNLLIGLVFIGYFCLPYESYQHFIQGLIFGGLLYTFLCISFVVARNDIGKIQSKKARLILVTPDKRLNQGGVAAGLATSCSPFRR